MAKFIKSKFRVLWGTVFSFFAGMFATNISAQDAASNDEAEAKAEETVVEEEDKKKPLTDDKLAGILKEKGYPIARRTVAKYREQLDIPVARLRKKI